MRGLDCFVPRNDVPAKKTKKINFFLDSIEKSRTFAVF